MTILQSLARLYDRQLAAGIAPKLGFSREKISYALVINREGRPLRLSDRRSKAGKKPTPMLMDVPAAVTRSSGIKSNLFWDKTAYVFGVIATETTDEDGKVQIVAGQGKRTAKEHAAFVAENLEVLQDATDPWLLAFAKFLQNWTPEQFADLGFDPQALDQNIIFQFDSGAGPQFIHDIPQVSSLLPDGDASGRGICLVTGKDGPLARLNPAIRGVQGAQSSGAPLVSFNDTAYESYGKEKGENAPISVSAAAAYGTALKVLLERKDSRDQERYLRIGDTTVVFWVEAEDPEVADWKEAMMGCAINPPNEDDETSTLRATLNDIAQGRGSADPRFDPDTRIYMLGLAPNAARLSVRFWHPGTFGDFARHITQFWNDLDIKPAPWKAPPAVWSLLYETALLRKAENIPPLLGGVLMRAVLTGGPLPRSLLSAVIRRIRADGDINGRRAAICKAVINRTTSLKEEEIPVSLDLENTNPAYCLGRLFAAYAYAEESYTKRSASLRDKYIAGASANPARVFPILMRGYEHNRTSLSKTQDKKKGYGITAEKAVESILDLLDGAKDFPTSLTLTEQGRFFVGFYHQTKNFYSGKDAVAKAATENKMETDT